MNVAKWLRKNRTYTVATILLVIAFVQMLYIITSTSMIVDEQFYPGVGKYTVTTGEYSPFAYRYHGVLPYFINSLFLYFDDNQVWEQKPFDMYAAMAAYGVDIYLFLTRLPIALTFVVLGVFVFKWARRLYGDNAALISLLLLSFSPTMLAHGSVATTDVVAAATLFISMYFLWKFHKKIDYTNSIISGAVFGLALLSKFTMLVFIPIVALMFIAYFRPVKKNLRIFVSYFIAAFIVVWVFYGFQTGTMINYVHSADRTEEFLEAKFPSNSTRSILISLMNTPIPAPTYINGALGYSIYASSEGFPTFFFGREINPKNGWDFWYYHLTAFLIKEPVPLIILVFMLLGGIIARKQKVLNKDNAFIIVPLIAVFILFSFFVNIKIGLRHLLPMYPFLFLLAGNIINYKFNPKMRSKYTTLILILLVWYVAEALLILPDNMAYFNQLIGGPDNGYKYLTDSNVDWGQGTKELAVYLRKNNITNPKIDLMMPKPEYIKLYIENYTSVSCGQDSGTLFIGVSKFNHYNAGCYGWLKNYTPIGTIGHSILVYNI